MLWQNKLRILKFLAWNSLGGHCTGEIPLLFIRELRSAVGTHLCCVNLPDELAPLLIKEGLGVVTCF